jgi:hypothetical protein
MEKQIAIATMTWARDEEEETLLRSALPYLAATGLPVFVTDGGSGSPFIEFLNSFPNFSILKPQAKGVWAQAGNSVKAAYEAGAEYILYTEPDKKDFFGQSLQGFLTHIDESLEPGIVLASRSASAFSTFPAFQKMTETTINNCCTEVTGNPQDYTYGPFVMNRNLVASFELVKEDIGWGWRPYVFAIAKRLGYPISNYTGDFNCPESQREDDAAERIYRMKQLQQNIHGILLSASVDIDRLG